MKQKITLLSFIFFMMLFSFGQKKELKDNRFVERSRIESQLKKLNRGENKHNNGPLFAKSRGAFKNSKVNSSQSISSPLVIKYRLDYETSQSWDETSSQWVNDLKTEYTYETKGNLTQYINYGWNGNSSQWVNNFKTEYTYDANGYLIQFIEYVLSEDQWFMKFKQEYTYDANGNQIQYILYEMIGTQWEKYVKAENTYDTSGNLTLFIGYGWDGNQWDITYKVEYTYDTYGNLTQYIDYWWEVDVSQWSYYTKTEYTFDNNGNLTQYIDYWWYYAVANWINDWKREYTYDTYENLTQYIDYNWDGFQWINDWKTDFTYNNSYSFSDLILPYLYNNTETKIFFNHMLTNGIGYLFDDTLNDWKTGSNFDFSYSEQDILSVSEIIEEQLKIYPNPVSNILTIKSDIVPIDKVEIYSVLGKKIKEIHLDFNNILTEDLSKGIYLLRIFTEKGAMVKKLIKE